MKQKKIRGHKRRLKQIEDWRQFHLSTDITAALKGHSYHYAKIRIDPWNGFTGGNNTIPQPKGKTKLALLGALLDIHEEWKSQLDALSEPYYLKTWLFDPYFTESEVVCAIGDKLARYDNTFLAGDDNKALSTFKYGILKEQLEKLQWQHHIDEFHIDNNIVGDEQQYATLQDYHETRRWFSRQMKKPHRTTVLHQPTEDYVEHYSFKKGDVWIGG